MNDPEFIWRYLGIINLTSYTYTRLNDGWSRDAGDAHENIEAYILHYHYWVTY